jgi:hypothetical protein
MQQPRSTSGTILLILMIVITAPIWLTLGGVFIGVFGGIIGGLFGAIFGVLGGLLGAFFGLIALPFKVLFGSFDFFDGGWFLSENTMFTIVLLILVVALFRRRTT